MSILHEIEFYSGVAWLPYCLLMVYLFYEQFKLRRYPQYLIMGFLLVGCILRCTWFLGNSNSGTLPYLFINRIAILCQFSALSLLIMMWARILKVTSNGQIEQVKGSTTTTPFPIDLEFSDSSPELSSLNSIHSSIPSNNSSKKSKGALVPASNSNKNKRGAADSDNSLTEPVLGVENGSNNESPQKYLWSHTVKLDKEWESQSACYFWVMVSVNVVVWIAILLLIFLSTYKYPRLYAYNIMLISLLCFSETLIILYVGLTTGLRITRDLAPVFAHERTHHGVYGWPFFTQLSMWCSILTLCCKKPASFQLHVQAEAVQKLLRVSCVVAVFFLLRSVGFCLTAIYVDVLQQDTFLGDFGYPWFFYQFPEFFPNIAIAYGIASSNGILRVCMTKLQLLCNCRQRQSSQALFSGYRNQNGGTGRRDRGLSSKVTSENRSSGGWAISSGPQFRPDIEEGDDGGFGNNFANADNNSEFGPSPAQSYASGTTGTWTGTWASGSSTQSNMSSSGNGNVSSPFMNRSGGVRGVQSQLSVHNNNNGKAALTPIRIEDFVTPGDSRQPSLHSSSQAQSPRSPYTVSASSSRALSAESYAASSLHSVGTLGGGQQPRVPVSIEQFENATVDGDTGNENDNNDGNDVGVPRNSSVFEMEA